MHIGVEATRLLREKRGIGRYVRNLLKEIPLCRDNIEFTVYVNRKTDRSALRELLQTIGTKAGLADVQDTGLIPRSTVDVMWYPWNWIRPAARCAPMAVTIHDIVPMIQLDHRWWKVWKRAKSRRRYLHSVKTAHAILADSTFTVQEIERALKADVTKVHEVLLASDDFVANASDSAPVLEQLGVGGAFFMAVGAHEARKNLPVLFSAMRELQRRGDTTPLVLCGPGTRLSNAGAGKTGEWLRYAGYVSDSELAALYRRATALVFPSRYEGFGLPVLEAMQCGGRVICANASSLPQVAGDAALLFPPDDVGALADTMQRLLGNASLCEEMTQRGLAQASRFKWSVTACESLNAFDAAIARYKRILA